MFYYNKNLYIQEIDSYFVSEYSAQKIQDEVIYKYKLRRKNGVWFTKISNEKIIGASIKGEILDTRGEEVKLHLDIDKKQNEGEASWFRFTAAAGNTMYGMPVKGTSARLYFPDGGDGETLVSGCVRNNGASSAKTSDTTKRYFGTEHGSEVEMTPSGFNLKGGSSSLSISMDDATGVKITISKN